MLSDRGTIAWDDYTSNPGVMQCGTELARELDPQLVHVLGTRMGLYTRAPIIHRLPPDDHASLPAL